MTPQIHVAFRIFAEQIRLELLVDSSGSELENQHAHSVGEREAERLAKDLPFLALELISPQLDGISDPADARSRFRGEEARKSNSRS